jgi:hypothetical protein
LVDQLRKSSQKVNERQINFKAWAQTLKNLLSPKELRNTIKWWELVSAGKHKEKFMKGALEGSGFFTPPRNDHEDILLHADKFAAALRAVV